jgi:hypothetical protein
MHPATDVGTTGVGQQWRRAVAATSYAARAMVTFFTVKLT